VRMRRAAVIWAHTTCARTECGCKVRAFGLCMQANVDNRAACSSCREGCPAGAQATARPTDTQLRHTPRVHTRMRVGYARRINRIMTHKSYVQNQRPVRFKWNTAPTSAPGLGSPSHIRLGTGTELFARALVHFARVAARPARNLGDCDGPCSLCMHKFQKPWTQTLVMFSVCSAVHATCSRQHATCSRQHATCSRQHATRHSPVQHTT
jgi:hypothetical protein